MAEKIDPRLICDDCGELAKFTPCIFSSAPAVQVTCERDGKLCCQTKACDSEQEAMADWEELQKEPMYRRDDG